MVGESVQLGHNHERSPPSDRHQKQELEDGTDVDRCRSTTPISAGPLHPSHPPALRFGIGTRDALTERFSDSRIAFGLDSILVPLFAYYSQFNFIHNFDPARHSSTKCAKARPLSVRFLCGKLDNASTLYNLSYRSPPGPTRLKTSQDRPPPLHEMQVPNSFSPHKPFYSHPLQLPSMSTRDFIYFPLVLQALFVSLLRVASRLSQCVARTFHTVSNHTPSGYPYLTQPSPPTALKGGLHSGMQPQAMRSEPSSNTRPTRKLSRSNMIISSLLTLFRDSARLLTW